PVVVHRPDPPPPDVSDGIPAGSTGGARRSFASGGKFVGGTKGPHLFRPTSPRKLIARGTFFRRDARKSGFPRNSDGRALESERARQRPSAPFHARPRG